MRITKPFRADQDNIKRFLDVLGGGSVELGQNRHARPDFFILAHDFMVGYIQGIFYRKEELLIKALEEAGFPQDEGPIAALRGEQIKSGNAAELLLASAKLWQAGDENERAAVGWATSEYTTFLRQHLDRLKNLIFPLLEQTNSDEDEQKIIDAVNLVTADDAIKSGTEKYLKLIEALEEELSDWK